MQQSMLHTRRGKVLRWALRLPIYLYRAHLGWILGSRFLLLTHAGRKTGLPRQSVIEVVKHDKAACTFFVVSGWGEKADWYRNIQKDPHVTVASGPQSFDAVAEFVPPARAVAVLQEYALAHPIAFKEIGRLFFGPRVDLDPGSVAELAARMPMVAFHCQGNNLRRNEAGVS